MEKFYGSLNFYKTTGALQVDYLPPRFTRTQDAIRREKDGAFLLQVAPGVKGAEKTWNWDQKIIFAFAHSDFCLVEQALKFQRKSEVKLIHDYKGKKTSLAIRAGEGKYENTFSLFFAQDDKRVMVPLAAAELSMILNLFKDLMPNMLGWGDR